MNRTIALAMLAMLISSPGNADQRVIKVLGTDEDYVCPTCSNLDFATKDLSMELDLPATAYDTSYASAGPNVDESFPDPCGDVPDPPCEYRVKILDSASYSGQSIQRVRFVVRDLGELSTSECTGLDDCTFYSSEEIVLRANIADDNNEPKTFRVQAVPNIEGDSTADLGSVDLQVWRYDDTNGTDDNCAEFTDVLNDGNGGIWDQVKVDLDHDSSEPSGTNCGKGTWDGFRLHIRIHPDKTIGSVDYSAKLDVVSSDQTPTKAVWRFAVSSNPIADCPDFDSADDDACYGDDCT